MTVDISKPADQVLADARKDVQQALPDEASKNAAGDKLSDSLQNDPVVKKKAYEDVKHLATTIRDIRVGFIKVASDLVGFDAAEFKDTKGQVIKLGPSWKPYIKQFDDTLQFSLEQATNAVVMMKGINAVLGDVAPPDGTDLKIELEQFMKQLKKKEEEALSVKDKFQQLADDVGLFSAKIDVALAEAAAAIKAAIQKAQDELKTLEKKLADLNEKIKSLGIATITEVATGAVAAGVAIFTLNPVAIFTAISSFIAAIGTGIALKKAMDERSTCLDDIEKKKREIQQLNERDELLKKYKEKLEATKGIVANISSQIAVIANIWQTINLDMHALNEDLNNNIGPDTKITKFFLKKLAVAKEIYQHLILLLETYVEEVHAADVPTGGA